MRVVSPTPNLIGPRTPEAMVAAAMVVVAMVGMAAVKVTLGHRV
jgi:hypothetical protein